MQKVTIEIPDGKRMIPYFIDEDLYDATIECFASRKAIEYVLDKDDKPTEEVVLNPEERARFVITTALNKQRGRYEEKKAADAVITKDSIS
jgi:hypothetical protein